MEAPDVIALLDAALLAFDRDDVRECVETGNAFVAVDHERHVGAIALEGTCITAIAVRPRYRRHGVGTELISIAAADRDRLTATYDSSDRAFYESNGFAIEVLDNGRLRGELDCS